MGKRRPRKKGTRRAYLKMFSGETVSTGRGPDKVAMEKCGYYLHARSLKDEEFKDRMPTVIKTEARSEYRSQIWKDNSLERITVFFNAEQYYFVVLHKSIQLESKTIYYIGKSRAEWVYKHRKFTFVEHIRTSPITPETPPPQLPSTQE
jgi:hypothetical protein